MKMSQHFVEKARRVSAVRAPPARRWPHDARITFTPKMAARMSSSKCRDASSCAAAERETKEPRRHSTKSPTAECCAAKQEGCRRRLARKAHEEPRAGRRRKTRVGAPPYSCCCRLQPTADDDVENARKWPSCSMFPLHQKVRPLPCSCPRALRPMSEKPPTTYK